MNFSKGVIRCRDIHQMTNESIIAELHDQGVIECRRILITRECQTIETTRLYLTGSAPRFRFHLEIRNLAH